MIRNLFMSLLLILAMVFSTIGPISASETMDCANMKSMPMKSDPAPKAPNCLDQAGCLLVCAKMPASAATEIGTAWTTVDFGSVTFPAFRGIDIAPDHSPPKSAA